MEIWKKWLEIFAKDVSAKTLEKYVTNEDCYLWHIFSYGFVNCIQGEAAEKEYMKVKYSEKYIFSEDKFAADKRNGRVIAVEESEVSDYTDIYITDKSFCWTFVKTHESDCGPYFCRVEGEINGN